jgi:hypothetical protein
MEIRKCGADSPDAMGERVNNGTCENVTIEFKETSDMSWKNFLARLRVLESEWEEVPETDRLLLEGNNPRILSAIRR